MNNEFSRKPRGVEGIPTWNTLNDHLIAKHNRIFKPGTDNEILLLHIDKGHDGNLRLTGGDEDTLHVHVNHVVDEQVEVRPWQLRLPRWPQKNQE